MTALEDAVLPTQGAHVVQIMVTAIMAIMASTGISINIGISMSMPRDPVLRPAVTLQLLVMAALASSARLAKKKNR